MAKQKQQRGKGSKSTAAQEKADKGDAASSMQPGDPLRAFPADPPQRNIALLLISVVLFAIWFCFLAYVALRG